MPQERWDLSKREAEISISDFLKVDIRAARVVSVEEFPEARNPSYKLTLDCGPLGMKRSSAAVKSWYAPSELIGRVVLCVVNFPPRIIAGFASEVLTMGVVEADRRVRVVFADDATLGARLA
ncbi:MAG: tRNA-binding protein [Thermoplasmatota archaeon]